MPDTLTTLITITGSAYLSKFVGPAAEAMGKAAWERAQQLGAKATALLGNVDREPQPVEPKILLPLVQAASLETDPTLAEKWAALLANAADPQRLIDVSASFVEILRQLAPIDALVLNMLYLHPLEENGISDSLVVSETHINGQFPEKRGAVVIGNLSRLGLCQGAGGNAQGYNVSGTALGFAFMNACMPPAASGS